MRYIVKKEDISGAIDGYPIEIIQAAVDRGVAQGNNADSVIRALQFSESGGFSWSDTSEGVGFWAPVMGKRKFSIFFQRYPRELADGVHYFVIDKGAKDWIDVAKTFLGEHPRFAFNGRSGDIFYIVQYGDSTVTGFALKDSPRYRWAIESGTKINL